MKRIKKQAVLESITLLENANEYVTADLKPDELLNILTQCQEAAILTGNDLETQGENTKELVTMLEEYCELIFRVSQSMDDPERRKQLAQSIRNLLIRLHSKTVELLPEDRKEIVFLPYKASMWDSLESVWKAADADPECDAYVIPIPYYDKNPDGSFREMHYEGDLFPDDVPITRYDAYSLEERRPDKIYIHNPYDGANYVTSVHPDYYSDKLKQYTNELIYIPYFVLQEVNPEDENAVKSIEHFALTPAVLHATKVIVQSEDMRKCYIKNLVNAFGEQTRGVWEKKIYGTGSPKFDKIVNLNKEDIKIPDEWMKYITKPDGSRKKIVFYNTSVTALLQNDEKMLTKMQQVFETFKEYKDDIALLWRPHPLIESTLTSMRPQLYEAYEKLKDQYIKEDWGIYDDTPDMDRAVAMSDAYYGDQSSVVQLCQKKEMPIMIQNADANLEGMKIQSNHMLLSLSVSCMYYENNGIWCVHSRLPMIMHVNTDTKTVDFVKVIYDELKDCLYMYRGIYKNGNEIILIPSNSYHIVIYSLDNDMFSYIEIKDACRNMFRGYVVQGMWLTLIPDAYHGFVKFNYATKEIVYEVEWKRKADLKCISSMCQYHSEYLCAIWGTNNILKCDLKKNEVKTLVMNDVYRISQIIYINNKIYIYDMGDMCLKEYNLEKNRVINTKKMGFKDAWLYGYRDIILISAVEKYCWQYFDREVNVQYNRKRCNKNRYALKSNFYCIDWSEGIDDVWGIDAENQIIHIVNNKVYIDRICMKVDDNNSIMRLIERIIIKEDNDYGLKNWIVEIGEIY